MNLNYYVYRDDNGEIEAWIQTERALPPPAEQVTKEFFIEHDFYIPEQEHPEPELAPDTSEDVWAEMAAAYRKGVQSA